MHGLVSMGSRTFDLTQGGIPDNDMEEINAHPGIYSGAVINLTWLQLEPQQNVFDDSALVSALANINAYNAKYPATPVTAKIRISAGTGTPPWVWELTGGPITVTSSACSGATCVTTAPVTMQIGAFWQPAYINAWRALQAHLASEYDSNPMIQEVAMSSCSSKTAEPFVVDLDFPLLVNMRQFGFSDAAYMACLSGAMDDYAAWVNTPLDLAFFPFFNTDSCTTSAAGCIQQNPTFTKQVMDAFRNALGTSRGVLANQGLNDPLATEFNGTLLPLYAEFQNLYNQAQAQDPPSESPLQFQTSAANVNWDGTVEIGLMYHPTEIEVWDTAAAGGPAQIGTTQVETYAALLNGASTPGDGPQLTSAASYKLGAAATQSLVTIFGSGLASSAGPSTMTLTDSTGTAQTATVIYSSPTQINALVPSGLTNGSAIVTIAPPNSIGVTGYFTLAPVTPGIFAAGEGGSGPAAAEVLIAQSDGTQITNLTFSCSGGTCAPSPISVNAPGGTVFLVLYGTGIRNRSALQNTSVSFGSQTVVPTYAGPQNQFSGLDQINVPIPSNLAHAGIVNVTFVADHVASNTVTIQIQ